MCVCVRVCVCVCVRACVRACVCVCVHRCPIYMGSEGYVLKLSIFRQIYAMKNVAKDDKQIGKLD